MNLSPSIVETLIAMNVQRIYGLTLEPSKAKALSRRICGTWPDITDAVNEWVTENNLQTPTP
jgi:hypothetical protein